MDKQNVINPDHEMFFSSLGINPKMPSERSQTNASITA
jgi:hypothetical protein